MPRITDATITAVYEQIAIDEVIGDYVHLKRKGNNLHGLCPFHQEKTPSFVVAPHKGTSGVYKCFGCGESGTAVNFVMEHDGLTYPEAIRHLCEKYNIAFELEEGTDEQRQLQAEKDAIYIANNFAKDYYVGQLKQSESTLNYLRGRGLDDATIERFELGLAKGKTDFYYAAIESHIDPDVTDKAGLTNNRRDFFRLRTIFPVHNLQGKVVGFNGRTLSSQGPKYLNTKDTLVYVKSKELYGIYQARKAIVRAKNVFFVEGQMDVLSMSQNGIENVVAGSGTAVTVEQMKILKRFTPKITFMLDSDKAGVKAALRAIDVALEVGFAVAAVLLPKGEDPASYLLSNGKSSFVSYVKANLKDFLSFQVGLLPNSQKGNAEAKSRLLKKVCESLAKIQDNLKAAAYVQAAAKLLEIPESVVRVEVEALGGFKIEMSKKNVEGKGKGLQLYQPKEQALSPTIQKDISSIEDRGLLSGFDFFRLLLLYGDLEVGGDCLAEYLLAQVLPLEIEFTHALAMPILDLAIDLLDKDSLLDVHTLMRSDNKELAAFAAQIAMEDGMDSDPAFSAKQLVYRLKSANIQYLVGQTLEQIKQAQSKCDMQELGLLFKVLSRFKAEQKECAMELKQVIC